MNLTKGHFVLSRACFHSQDSGGVFPRSTAQQGMYAKQILRIAVVQTALALGQAMDIDERNTQPLEPTVENSMSALILEQFVDFRLLLMIFAAFMIAVCALCFMMPEPDPEDAGEESGSELDACIPLCASYVRCYTLSSMSFTRLRQLMTRDPQQRGRGFAVLDQQFEDNRPNGNQFQFAL